MDNAKRILSICILLLQTFCNSQFAQERQSSKELEFPSPNSPLLLSLCTSLVTAQLSQSDQFPTSRFSRRPGGRPASVSRSLALLSRPGQIAQLGLFNAANDGGNGTAEQEWTRAEEARELRCTLRLEGCPECLMLMEWESPRTHFSSFQIGSLATCESTAEDGDLLRARNDDHRPCFSLHLIEERADRPLPPNAESLEDSRAIFDPAFVYRRTSIWDIPADIGDSSKESAQQTEREQFRSTGNSMLIVATFRHIGQDAQLSRWLRRLFPMRISVFENKLLFLAQVPALPNTVENSAVLPSGFIQSARFPAAYPRGIRQNLTIVQRRSDNAPGFAQMRIWFDDFHLHYISELKILDADNRELFNSRREHRRPPALVTPSAAVSILFSAREFTEPIGFRARYELASADDAWVDRPSPKNCDELLDGFGGRISLDGQRHLLGEWLDCIWLIGRLSTGANPAAQYDQLYLRVEHFHLRGQQLELEVRDGGHSQGRLLLSVEDEQSPKQLVQKQPEEGFVLAQTVDGNPPALYVRLRGRPESLAGLSILYSQFYRWPTALCPGGPDEFHCDNGRCIRASLRCDGYDHCGDSSDELCHFPERTASDNDDLSTWPSSALTIAFGALTLFLLLLLLVLFASRSARRALVPSPLGQLYSLQSVRRRLRQQQQPRPCCGGGQLHRTTATSAATAGSQRNGARQEQQQPTRPTQQGGHRNSSAMATQLDFAMLNNLLGSAAANLGPSIQTLGERRFFVLPADQAPISVIEAPPTYQDALKHPKVTPRGSSRRLVHPSEGPILPRRSSEGNAAAYQNLGFQLSPSELLRLEMGGQQQSGTVDTVNEEEGEDGQQENQNEEDESNSPGLLSRSTSPAESPRSPIGPYPFQTIDLDELDTNLDGPEPGPSTSNHSMGFPDNVRSRSTSRADSEVQQTSARLSQQEEEQNSPPSQSTPNTFRSEDNSQNVTESEGPTNSQFARTQPAPKQIPLRIRPASSRRSTVGGTPLDGQNSS